MVGTSSMSKIATTETRTRSADTKSKGAKIILWGIQQNKKHILSNVLWG